MGELLNRLNSLVLSATEVRDLTGWSDPMIEDYLNILRNILEITEVVESETNGSDESKQLLTENSALISKLYARVNRLDEKPFEIEIITEDFTTSKRQIVICKNTIDIEVTLDPNAIAEDEVHIKRKDKKIKVIGLIDGVQNKVINIKNYSMHLVYDGTEWSEI